MSQTEFYAKWKAEQRLELDAIKARAAKEEGIARAEAGAPEWWKSEAYQAILAVARQQQYFTADEVWMKLGECPDGVTPSALGPIMRSVEQTGAIRATGRFQQTRIARRHRQLMVWESLSR